MLYVVSGFMRSGTSMMMDALSAGTRPAGIPAVWSRERDEAMNARHGDDQFRPNESYREIPLAEYGGLDFPLKYDGCLVKIMSWGLAQMRRIPHRVAFLVRDPLEIAESMERSFGEGPTLSVDGCKVRALDEPDRWAAQYRATMKAAIVSAECRPDCLSLDVFDYADVLADTADVFGRLRSHGWPVDVDLATAVVRPERRRVNGGELLHR